MNNGQEEMYDALSSQALYALDMDYQRTLSYEKQSLPCRKVDHEIISSSNENPYQSLSNEEDEDESLSNEEVEKAESQKSPLPQESLPIQHPYSPKSRKQIQLSMPSHVKGPSWGKDITDEALIQLVYSLQKKEEE